MLEILQAKDSQQCLAHSRGSVNEVVTDGSRSGTARPRLDPGVGKGPDFGGSRLGSKRKLEGL